MGGAWPRGGPRVCYPLATKGRLSLRLRALGSTAVGASWFGLVQLSQALVQPKDADAPHVSAGKAPRAQRTTVFEHGNKLAAAGLAGWTAIWDRDTDVPLQLW